MIEPIKPEEIAEAKAKYFPDFVIESVNALIAGCYTNGRANIKQKDIIAEIIKRGSITRDEIFDKGYLNFEEIYRSAGWSVNYDKPAYNESYDANFTFKKKN